jgi:hypothetical protein
MIEALAFINKAAINVCAGFCVDISFQFILVNTQNDHMAIIYLVL